MLPCYDKNFIGRNIIQSHKISSHNIFHLLILFYLALHWSIFIKKSSSPFCPSIYSLLDTVFHSALMQIKLFCTDALFYFADKCHQWKNHCGPSTNQGMLLWRLLQAAAPGACPGIEEGFQNSAELKIPKITAVPLIAGTRTEGRRSRG